jgi:hypothetical protein
MHSQVLTDFTHDLRRADAEQGKARTELRPTSHAYALFERDWDTRLAEQYLTDVERFVQTNRQTKFLAQGPWSEHDPVPAWWEPNPLDSKHAERRPRSDVEHLNTLALAVIQERMAGGWDAAVSPTYLAIRLAIAERTAVRVLARLRRNRLIEQTGPSERTNPARYALTEKGKAKLCPEVSPSVCLEVSEAVTRESLEVGGRRSSYKEEAVTRKSLKTRPKPGLWRGLLKVASSILATFLRQA